MSMESIVFMNNQKAKIMNGLSNNREIQVQGAIGLLLTSKEMSTLLKSFSELVAGWTTLR